MKNTLKRILLLLPVISVLLVALAVPAFADGTDGGYVEPVTLVDVAYYVDASDSGRRTIDVILGVPVSLDAGNTYLFPYLLEVDVASMVGVSLDIPSDYVFVANFDIGVERSYFVSGMTSDGVSLRVNSLLVPDDSYFNGQFGLATINGLRILCTEDLLPYLANIDYTYYTLEPSPVDGFTSVWTGIMTWITSALNSVMGAFYVDGSLTLLGTLAVIGVSVGIGFLLIGLIQRFLHLRG